MKTGRSAYGLRRMKKSSPYLIFVAFMEIDWKEKVIPGQNAHEFIRPLEYKTEIGNKQWFLRLLPV